MCKGHSTLKVNQSRINTVLKQRQLSIEYRWLSLSCSKYREKKNIKPNVADIFLSNYFTISEHESKSYQVGFFLRVNQPRNISNRQLKTEPTAETLNHNIISSRGKMGYFFSQIRIRINSEIMQVCNLGIPGRNCSLGQS